MTIPDALARLTASLTAAPLTPDHAVQHVIAAYWAGQRTTKSARGPRELVESVLPEARALYRRLRRETTGQAQKLNLAGLPRPLRWLIDELLRAIGGLTGDLASNVLGVDVWLREMERELAKHAAAAWMAGKGSELLDGAALARLGEQVGVQLGFLRNFAVEMQADDQFQPGYQARAESYAEGIKAPYWDGKTEVLPLPAMPTQGTQCGQRCNCRWEVKVLDRAAGDYDCYWILDPRSEHCQTCLERAEQWNPIRIRGFVLQD